MANKEGCSPVFLSIITIALSFANAQTSPWEIAYRSGMTARSEGRFEEARQQLQTALAASDPVLQEFQRARISTALAGLYAARGEMANADFHYASALRVVENLPNEDPALTVAILSEVALFRLEQKRPEEAHDLLDGALRLSLKEFGDRSQITATASARLARLWAHEGKQDIAERLLERAIAIYDRVQPPPTTDWIMALTELGELYAARGRYATAEPLLQRANALARQLGETSYLVSQTLSTLADLYRLWGNPARGAPLLRKALAISEQSLGPESAAVADVLLDMSNDSIADGHYALAEEQIQRALGILSKTNGPESSLAAFGESLLAKVYLSERRYPEAERLLHHALAVVESSYPAGLPAVANCLYLMAELAKAQRHYAEADQNYKMAISMYENAIGVSPGLILAVRHYADFLETTHAAEAKAFSARAKKLQNILKSLR